MMRRLTKKAIFQAQERLKLPEAGRGLERILLSQPLEKTNPADTLISDFRPPEL